MEDLKNNDEIISKEMWERIDEEDKDNEAINRKSLTYFQDSWRRLKKNKLAMIGLGVVVLLILIAIFGPLFSPYSYSDQNLRFASLSPRLGLHKISDNTYVHLASGLKLYITSKDGKVLKLLDPIKQDVIKKNKVYEINGEKVIVDFSKKPFDLLNESGDQFPYYKKVWNKTYYLGSDDLGRDVLVRVIYGARISLLIAFIATIVNFFIGILYGGISGYAGGKVDNIMMRIVDIISTVPLMLYVILLMVVLGSGLKPIIIALGSVYWVQMARIVRGQVLSLKEEEYVMSARVIGASHFRILLRHLLPNAMGPIIVSMTMMIPRAIFVEAFLSFIGLGVSAPKASWGTLANDALASLRSYPYQLFSPAIAICITMLAFNFLGDGLRDALDPRLRK
ncbi:ABC transporter permease [Dethiothermospora halolimnae]|uniref:ABC transporter permease n=1 Tax=Dethiothermospora halolimnae TaxID=3114390 RepID=UPI003CCC3BCA